MSNTFLTPTMIARDAAIALNNRLIVGNAVSRDKEGMFTASKIGDTVQVSIPPAVVDAGEFTGSTTASDQTETQIGLTLEKHFYKRVDLTSKQKSLELSDFTRLVTLPCVQGIQESIDKYILKQMRVFRKNLAGSVGNRPSTMAHVVAARQKLKDLKVGGDMFNALIDTTAETSFLQLSNFVNLDYGPDSGAAGRMGALGMRYGFNFITNANLGAFVRSAAANDIAGTVVVNGASAAGSTVLNIDGITSATGTIYAGTTFVVAGDTTRYVVRKDAAIVDNATQLTVTPPFAITQDDGDALTFEAAGYSNLVYAPNAVAAAIVAPTPLASANSAVQSFGGVSIRVSMDSSIATLADSVVYDVFVGARVIQPDGGALFCG